MSRTGSWALFFARLGVMAVGLSGLVPSALAYADADVVDLHAFAPPPDPKELGEGMQDRLIRYGRDLILRTPALIGPDAPNRALRFTGNHLACGSCHLEGGYRPGGLPLLGMAAIFPKYRARENAINSLQDRINGCMNRSMNGRALPYQSTEMMAFVAYITHLSRGVPIGATLKGTGTPPIALLDRPADPLRGAGLFREKCSSCHGPRGQGVRTGVAGDGGGYKYPPLWGPDSFNDGAASARLLTLARFIRANMPFGLARPDAPVLTDEEATDVAAYIVAQPRPHQARLDRDFPARWNKPVDAAFPPYGDGASARQHKYGPFGQLETMAKQKRHAE